MEVRCAVGRRRAAVTLMAGAELIRHSDWMLLLGATVHHFGIWTAMIRDGKACLQAQLRSRVNALQKTCQNADLKT